MAAWWMLVLAGQAAGGTDDLSHFDLAAVKGTANACDLIDVPAGDIVVCARKPKAMDVPVKPVDWSEKPVRANLSLPGGVEATAKVEDRAPGPPGVHTPTPMIHFKLKF